MFEDFLPGARNLVDALKTPEGKRALVAFGINLMQPVPFGQSPIGQIGQSIGAGLDTYDEAKKAQAASDKEALDAEQKNRQLDIMQENADTSAKSKGGLSFSQLFSADRNDKKDRAKFYDDYAKNIYNNTRDPLTGKSTNPDYEGMTVDDIRNKLLSDPVSKKTMDDAYDARMGGGTSPAATAPSAAPAPAPAPSGGEDTPVSQGAPGSAAAADRSTKSWILSHTAQWTAIMNLKKAGDPRAENYLNQLRGVVSDPDAVDQEVKGELRGQ